MRSNKWTANKFLTKIGFERIRTRSRSSQAHMAVVINHELLWSLTSTRFIPLSSFPSYPTKMAIDLVYTKLSRIKDEKTSNLSGAWNRKKTAMLKYFQIYLLCFSRSARLHHISNDWWKLDNKRKKSWKTKKIAFSGWLQNTKNATFWRKNEKNSVSPL